MTAIPADTGTEVLMPALGDSVEEATVTRWLKSPGDTVQADEPLLEVATDKVDTEIPAPFDGIVVRILADEDAVVAIGQPLAVIAEAASSSIRPPTPTPAVESADGREPTNSPPTQVVSEISTRAVLVSEPPHSEPEYRVSPPADQPAEHEHPTAPPQPAHIGEANNGVSISVRLPRIRQTIARRMVESLHTAAQLTTVVEADVTAIAHLRQRHKDAFFEQTGVKLTFLPFFVRAAIDALATHKMLNASLNDDVTEVTYHNTCHLGIAVDSPSGLMVPVIRNADDLGLAGLARSIAALAERVRSKQITADELSGGTFTITNTGSRGALFDTPIINQPQTGILGIGSVVERVAPMRDPESSLRIAVRSMAYLSLSYDHRLVDGADAARFLTAIKTRLETGFSASELA